MATESDEGSAEDTEADGGAGSSSGTASVGEEAEAPLSGMTGEDDHDTLESEPDDESENEFSDFMRSVIVTTCASLLGMLAGIAAMLFATTQVGAEPETDNLLGFAILMGAVFVQFPLYSILGMEPEEFGTKTQLYVFAMTLFMWFITWTVLLTTGALL